MRSDDVLSVLSRVFPDGEQKDIVTLGWVKGLVVQGNQVGFVLDIPHKDAPQLPTLKDRAESALKQAYPSAALRIVTTTHTAPKAPKPKTHGSSQPVILPQIRRILAVASGKGGVGKSTVALGIARALKDQGERVGLLDLDIFGPSLPTLLGALPPPPIERTQKNDSPHHRQPDGTIHRLYGGSKQSRDLARPHGHGRSGAAVSRYRLAPTGYAGFGFAPGHGGCTADAGAKGELKRGHSGHNPP